MGIRRRPKSKRSITIQSQKIRAIIEPPEDSDSEDKRPLDTIPLRLSVKISAREEGVATGRGSSGMMTHDKREHRERKTRAKRAKENTTRPPLVVSRIVYRRRANRRRKVIVREPKRVPGDKN